MTFLLLPRSIMLVRLVLGSHLRILLLRCFLHRTHARWHFSNERSTRLAADNHLGATSAVCIRSFLHTRFRESVIGRFRRAYSSPPSEKRQRVFKPSVGTFSLVYRVQREQGVKAYTPVTQSELQDVREDAHDPENDKLIDALIAKVEENRMEEIEQEPIVEYREAVEEIGKGELIFPERSRRSSSSESRSPERSRHHSHSQGKHRSRSRSHDFVSENRSRKRHGKGVVCWLVAHTKHSYRRYLFVC